MKIKPIYILLGFVAIVLLALIVFFYQKSKKPLERLPDEQITQSTNDSPVFNPLPQKNSGGVDLESPRVKVSMKEINSLVPFLPYTATVQYENEQLEIVIPNNVIIEHPWLLQVYIYGVDYTVLPTDSNYPREKQKFLFGVSEVKKWVREKGFNDSNIQYQWADSIQDIKTTTDWLK